MTIDLAEFAALQVKCDGAFPCQCLVNFTDIDRDSASFGASFCVEGEIDFTKGKIDISPERVRQARDRKRAEFETAE